MKVGLVISGGLEKRACQRAAARDWDRERPGGVGGSGEKGRWQFPKMADPRSIGFPRMSCSASSRPPGMRRTEAREGKVGGP
jgi:hypothetical protein